MASPFDLTPRQLWPTTLFHRVWPDHAREGPGILEFLYRLRGEATGVVSGVAPAAKSAHGLFESDFDLFARDHPGLKRLMAFIGQSVQQAVAHVNGPKVPPGKIRVEVPDSWFHITNGGGHHDAHYHGGCSWCGIYYLQAGESAAAAGGAPNGVNRFYSPLGRGGAHADYGNAYLGAVYVDVPPQDGLLLLFPSYLLHSALPYRGATDRVVISFNSRATVAS
jgi:uncharacterized protein (TIGR02466 family)